MQDSSDYKGTKEIAKKFYAGIGQVFCPALHQNIHFTAMGFNHLIFKGSRIERSKFVQIERFELLPLALDLLKISTIYQEFEVTRKFTYWGIIGILNNRKLKVVLRKSHQSTKVQFWSIIPNPTTSRRRDKKFFNETKIPP